MSWLEKKGLLKLLASDMGDFFIGSKVTPELEVLIESLFGLVGYLAGADRIVTSHEAEFANKLMRELQLPTRGCEAALNAFERGRRREIDVDALLKRFLAMYPADSDVAKRLYGATIDMALADERLRATERVFLEQITTGMGYDKAYLERRLAKFTGPPK